MNQTQCDNINVLIGRVMAHLRDKEILMKGALTPDRYDLLAHYGKALAELTKSTREIILEAIPRVVVDIDVREEVNLDLRGVRMVTMGKIIAAKTLRGLVKKLERRGIISQNQLENIIENGLLELNDDEVLYGGTYASLAMTDITLLNNARVYIIYEGKDPEGEHYAVRVIQRSS